MKTQIFLFTVVLFLFTSCPANPFSFYNYIGDDTLKIQIEIEITSSSLTRVAKLFDRLKKDDMLQVYIRPENNCVVWLIIENDQGSEVVSTAVLLGKNVNVLPDRKSSYIVDGKSSYEKFTFIFASAEDADLIKSPYNNIDLKSLIAGIKKNSEIIIAEEGDPLISISGNVRDPFGTNMRTYKGIDQLIVEFRFDVKK